MLQIICSEANGIPPLGKFNLRLSPGIVEVVVGKGWSSIKKEPMAVNRYGQMIPMPKRLRKLPGIMPNLSQASVL